MLVTRIFGACAAEVAGRVRVRPEEVRWSQVFWKVLAGVVAVWLIFVLLGVIIKGLFWLVTCAVIAAGIYLVVKVFSGSSQTDPSRRR